MGGKAEGTAHLRLCLGVHLVGELFQQTLQAIFHKSFEQGPGEVELNRRHNDPSIPVETVFVVSSNWFPQRCST